MEPGVDGHTELGVSSAVETEEVSSGAETEEMMLQLGYCTCPGKNNHRCKGPHPLECLFHL